MPDTHCNPGDTAQLALAAIKNALGGAVDVQNGTRLKNALLSVFTITRDVFGQATVTHNPVSGVTSAADGSIILPPAQQSLVEHAKSVSEPMLKLLKTLRALDGSEADDLNAAKCRIEAHVNVALSEFGSSLGPNRLRLATIVRLLPNDIQCLRDSIGLRQYVTTQDEELLDRNIKTLYGYAMMLTTLWVEFARPDSHGPSLIAETARLDRWLACAKDSLQEVSAAVDECFSTCERNEDVQVWVPVTTGGAESHVPVRFGQFIAWIDDLAQKGADLVECGGTLAAEALALDLNEAVRTAKLILAKYDKPVPPTRPCPDLVAPLTELCQHLAETRNIAQAIARGAYEDEQAPAEEKQLEYIPDLHEKIEEKRRVIEDVVDTITAGGAGKDTLPIKKRIKKRVQDRLSRITSHIKE